MKRTIMKLLGAKYMVGNPTKFYWNFSSALAAARASHAMNETVWSIDYKRIYRHDGGMFRLSNKAHADDNFNLRGG